MTKCRLGRILNRGIQRGLGAQNFEKAAFSSKAAGVEERVGEPGGIHEEMS